jgi:hypothetical protein
MNECEYKHERIWIILSPCIILDKSMKEEEEKEFKEE